MTSNSYGFDFLKSEHTLRDDPYNNQYSNHQYDATTTTTTTTTNSNGSSDNQFLMDDESFRHREMLAMNKPALEKQYDILAFLQKHTRRTQSSNNNNNGIHHDQYSSLSSSSPSFKTTSLPPNIIYRATGIDIQRDVQVQEMIHNNPKVHIEYIPDPENPNLMIPHYMYQAKYPNIVDRTTLIAQINRMGDTGIPMIRDLYDCYSTIEQDIYQCICSGDIIAIQNTDDRDKILFPRGDLFLTELDGIITLPPEEKVENTKTTSTSTSEVGKDKLDSSRNVSSVNDNTNDNGNPNIVQNKCDNNNDEIRKETTSDILNPTNDALLGSTPSTTKTPNNSNTTKSANDNSKKEDPTTTTKPEIYIVDTDIDPRKQIRRGEAIQIGGQWFRVSSAIKAGVSLSEQPVRAQAPLSVVSHTDLSSRNEIDGYIRPLSSSQIPMDDSLSAVAIQNLRNAKATRETLLQLAQSISGGGSTSSNPGVGSHLLGGTNRHNSNSISGIIGQLIGSHAHAANPTKLAASLATTLQHQYHPQSGLGTNYNQQQRKRPHVTSSNNTNATVQRLGSSIPSSTTASMKSINQMKITLEKAASDPSVALYSHARRHGCSKDIRDMYFATRKQVPESDQELQRLLVEYKLLEPNEMMRRPRLMNLKALSGLDGNKSNLDNDGKPKKRRYYERKNQRMTNTHLEGTEIGALLALAAEKQKQGKSVGDGGM